MKRLGLVFFFVLSACQNTPNEKWNIKNDMTSAPGWVSVFQTWTSKDQTTINVLRPRLTEISYQVFIDNGEVPQFSKDKVVKVQKTIEGPQVHWKVDRLHLKSLKPNQKYVLAMFSAYKNRLIDWRRFQTLDLSENETKFIVGSCMSDSHAFSHVREKIWDRMLTHQADFIMLLGDQVYVDDFDFVKRQKATEFDIWTRYIDSFRKIPLFKSRDLIPIYAVWDDHDYGTNNSDKRFQSKDAARKIFTAFFGGHPIKGVIEEENSGIYFSFKGFQQKFLLMDNRYFREPKTTNPYGHWGKKQHQWFKSQLSQSDVPVWIANGGQFFTKATYIEQPGGKTKKINETFSADHPKHFNNLVADIKTAKEPVAFLSGDIHYTEIVGVEKSLLGYETYEITSSPIHSYIFRAKKGPEKWLDNPRRILSVKEHNYVVVDSKAQKDGLNLKVQSFGVTQKAPYFTKELKIKK